MNSFAFVDDARVMSKGQITIPKKVRIALGINAGDRVTFVVDGNQVRIANSAIYTLEQFQKNMTGEAQKAGFSSEDEIAEWITESRRKEAAE
jgi:AbrB family looped-hinge helix DNA binding protein